MTTTFLSRPLHAPSWPRAHVWTFCGQLAIVMAMLVGFGAVTGVRPNLLGAGLLMLTIATWLLGPRGRLRHLYVSGAVVCYFAWWIASYMWTFNSFGWRRETEALFPIVISLVALAALLPIDAVLRAFVVTAQAGIVWTVVYTGTHLGTATSHSNGDSGWHGPFAHKNAMAPFMVLAALVLLCFDQRTVTKRIGVGIALMLVVLSQSTTTYAAVVFVVGLCLILERIERADRAAVSTWLMATTTLAVVAGTLTTVFMPVLLSSRGKDATLSSRTIIWHGVNEAISERPLLGYGVGGVWIDASAFPTVNILRPLGFTVFHSHNGYLETMLQLGVIGLGLLTFLILAAGRVAFVLFRRSHPLGRFTLCFLLLILLTSITEVTTFGLWLGLLCMLHTFNLRVVATTGT